MAPVDRSNYINREMMCAATMYEMFINTITQNDDGTLSNLGDISLNYLEYVASDSSRVFLDLLVANISMLLPILMDEYLEKDNIEVLFNKYGEFFKERKSDYSYFKNKNQKNVYETRHRQNLGESVTNL